MRRSILACGLLLAFAGMATAAAAGTASRNNRSTVRFPRPATTAHGRHDRLRKAPSRWELRTAAAWRRHIRRFRADTRRWLTVMRGRPPAGISRSLAARSLARAAATARTALAAPSHTARGGTRRTRPDCRDWLCIHRYEGSWADSGSPYWGGLQMDLSFQQTYGGWLLRHKGTADHWSPLEQIWVAVRASHSRGFSPWPNTARDCGLY